jgi:hypothetical protein
MLEEGRSKKPRELGSQAEQRKVWVRRLECAMQVRRSSRYVSKKAMSKL